VQAFAKWAIVDIGMPKPPPIALSHRSKNCSPVIDFFDRAAYRAMRSRTSATRISAS
jgi:hypothetical protein